MLRGFTVVLLLGSISEQPWEQLSHQKERELWVYGARGKKLAFDENYTVNQDIKTEPNISSIEMGCSVFSENGNMKQELHWIGLWN